MVSNDIETKVPETTEETVVSEPQQNVELTLEEKMASQMINGKVALEVVKKQKRRRAVKRGVFIGCMLALAIINFLVFWVYVNFNSILLAFQTQTRQGIIWGFEQFTKFFDQFSNEFAEPRLADALGRTLILFVLCNIVMMPLNLIITYILFKKIPGEKFFRVIFFLPSIISGAVLVGVFRRIFAVDGPINELITSITGTLYDRNWIASKEWLFTTVLIYVFWTSWGGNVVLLTGAVYRIPTDVLEYASLDGVGFFRELFQIIIPMIWPTLSTLLTFAAAGLFTNSGPVLLFDEKNQYDTVTLGHFIYMQVKQYGNYNYPSAIGLIFTALGFPIVLIVKWALGKVYEDVEY